MSRIDAIVRDLGLALKDPDLAEDALNRARDAVGQMRSETAALVLAIRATEAEIARRAKQAEAVS